MTHETRESTGALARLDAAIEKLDRAPAFAKARYQEPVFAAGSDLLDTDGGLAALLERAPRFDAVGVFRGGPWEDVTKLLPDLVRYGLLGDGVYPTVEAMSELRLLAIARGDVDHPDLSAEDAAGFLREVCVRSLDLMFPADSEASRRQPKLYDRAERLFAAIRDVLSLDRLLTSVVEEIRLMTVQRPVRDSRITTLVDQAALLPDADADPGARDALRSYGAALGAATPLAAAAGDPVTYRRRLAECDDGEVLQECRRFGASLREVGLTSPYHAVALRAVARRMPEQLGDAIGADEAGAAHAAKCGELPAALVKAAVFPGTHRTILGLVGLLERHLLARPEVAAGLRRLLQLDVLSDVADRLIRTRPENEGLSENAILVSGAILVLGLPLGVGQGNSPTCQAARGISLWSLHAPGMLLGKIANAARDGFVAAEFEGQELRSDRCADVASGESGSDLDPVSLLLVPHLDRIYATMLGLAAGRNTDPHRWVNPAMYGRWVAPGFASALDPSSVTVSHHSLFVRRFYATHHPDYNDGHELVYPNPVGIMVTDVHGRLLGPHAVSIQRIAKRPDDTVRVYFFNPNDEGRQDWGDGVEPSVFGHGERPGESSLGIDDFVSRLYAFHFDPQEEGDAYAVPDTLVSHVSGRAASSWGRSYTWHS